MTETEPNYCTCPPLVDLLHAYADGGEVPCAVHRPAPRSAAPSIALNNDPALIGRIRGALGPGEHLRTDNHGNLDD